MEITTKVNQLISMIYDLQDAFDMLEDFHPQKLKDLWDRLDNKSETDDMVKSQIAEFSDIMLKACHVMLLVDKKFPKLPFNKKSRTLEKKVDSMMEYAYLPGFMHGKALRMTSIFVALLEPIESSIKESRPYLFDLLESSRKYIKDQNEYAEMNKDKKFIEDHSSNKEIWTE